MKKNSVRFGSVLDKFGSVRFGSVLADLVFGSVEVQFSEPMQFSKLSKER